MSNIKNENGIKTPFLKGGIAKLREQLEHRAIWLAVLSDEAEKHGLKLQDFAKEAIFRCGTIQGKTLSGGSKSFKTLKKNLFGFFAKKVFEMKFIECDDDKLSIDFYYCPLVKAWQKMGYDDEKIKALCDCAMCGDRGIISEFGGKLNLEQTIAEGKDFCKIRFVRGGADESAEKESGAEQNTDNEKTAKA